ncbi:hypothetical protein COPRO5265_0087 [Coprothermobacter proteolyticus DSM 5265]|nr:hypothetical protein COPRO5265_0087 [Coprothermobacter proteolyticus DSM 5265]
MDFRDLKKRLTEFSVRAPGSEQTRKLLEHLKQEFPGYEQETVDFKCPQHKGWSWGSLLLLEVAGLFLLQRRPLLSVILVVIPALLLLWEENGYVNWSRLFSFTRCQNLVLKKMPEQKEAEEKENTAEQDYSVPHVIFVVNVDSRVEGLWDRFDPEGVGRTAWLNLSLMLASFTSVLSFYFPIRFWLYLGLALSVVLLLEMVDFIYQGLFRRFYPGALDNGSGMLVLKQISDLLDNVPHWMLFVDGGNVSGAGIDAFKRRYKLPRNVLFITLERPGAGTVAVARRHGLWSAVGMPKQVVAFLTKEAGINNFTDFSYRRSLGAFLNFRGCASLSVVGQLRGKEESQLMLTDTIECISDKNIQEAGALVLRLVNMIEQPEDNESGSGNTTDSN